MRNPPVYLDYNATTPCDPKVVEAMLPFFTEQFGNAASRTHAYGWLAEEAVEEARAQLARVIGAEPLEIIFTSGATEAANLAIKGMFERASGPDKHIITLKTEHKAVLDCCRRVEEAGGTVTYLEVNAAGLPDVQELEAAIQPNTALIAAMYANNETGVIQPVKEIAGIAAKHGVPFFCDAVQAVGKIPVDVKEEGVDLLAFSAHKMYGPKGVGALYISRKLSGRKPVPQIEGGGHERGQRSGTLNVPGIVGFGKAAELAMAGMEAEFSRLKRLRDKLENALRRVEGSHVNGYSSPRLPHVCNISFEAVEGERLLLQLAKSLAVSSGSACSSVTQQPSHVLEAMGVPHRLAMSTLRLSLGRFTTEEEVDFAIGEIGKTIEILRQVRK
ncbi:cysteine desulfurase family protein [Nafulsella turpanensis]|uniref:cysteine desulfurase family protein n=1 Tax=Nafulsella turpanensis TaxID=1265690 RepID=UPI00034AB4AC|nr:cysteine desulfurase family protein [Nafulsella turpanensis]